MKLKSSLILTVAALLIIGCATVGPKSDLLISDSQTVAEQTFVSGVRYYLEDIYDYDVFFIIQPVIKQAPASQIQCQYYLKDIYDYDEVFFIAKTVIKQTDDSKSLLDHFAALSIFNETPFPLTGPVPEQALVSGDQYYLEDLYDYDEAFLTTKPVVMQTDDSKNLLDYFAVFSIYDETPLSTPGPIPEQTLVSGNQYYLEDLYDYDEAFLTTKPVVMQTDDSKNLLDYFAVFSIYDETPLSTPGPVPEQTLVSGNQYYLEDIYDYDEPYVITKTSGKN